MGTDFQISVVNMKGLIILGFLTLAAAAPPIQPRAQTCAKVPSWMKSAFSSTDRIVGGMNAGSAIPWQVSMRSGDGKGDTHFCGGTILDANTVLSAAHCFHNGIADVVVVAGAHKRSVMTGVQISAVSKAIYNQDAKYNKANMDNDIVILKLKTALKFNANVQPACLPTTTFAPENKKSMSVVSGWGTLKAGGNLPDILQYVNVPMMTNADCKKTGYSADSIKPSMVCAGYKKGGKDSCQGDSGGPLVVPSGDSAIVVGVVSWGAGCAGPDLPGVYARVTKFIDWIKKNMNSSNGTPSPPPPPSPTPSTPAPTPKPSSSTAAPTPSSSSSTTKSSTTTTSDDYGNYGTYGTYGRAEYDYSE